MPLFLLAGANWPHRPASHQNIILEIIIHTQVRGGRGQNVCWHEILIAHSPIPRSHKDPVRILMPLTFSLSVSCRILRDNFTRCHGGPRGLLAAHSHLLAALKIHSLVMPLPFRQLLLNYTPPPPQKVFSSCDFLDKKSKFYYQTIFFFFCSN